MRNYILLFSLVSLIATGNATMFYVGRDVISPYHEVQPAIDDAQAGDTIVVAPGRGYNGFEVDKPLLIIGAGTSTLMNQGSKIDGSVIVTAPASGTELRSLWIYGEPYQFSGIVEIESGSHDILLRRCFIENVCTIAYCGHGVCVRDSCYVTLIQCILYSHGDCPLEFGNRSVINVESSALAGGSDCILGNDLQGELYILNTVFSPPSWGGSGGIYTSASSWVVNSVCIGFPLFHLGQPHPRIDTSYCCEYCDSSNFIRSIQGDARNSDYHLVPGSSLIDAGDPDSSRDLDSSIADIGIYGGLHPYVDGGVPDFPFIIELEANYNVPQNGVLPIWSRGRIGPNY